MATILDNFNPLQGTKVMKDHEVRRGFHFVTEGGAQRQVSTPITKYIGAQTAPEWIDVEPGNVFGLSSSLLTDTEVKQTSLRRCAIYRQISPLPRIR